MYNEILVPIDIQEESSYAKAVPTAIEICRKFGKKIHLMTVLPSYGMPLVGSFFPADFEKKALVETEANLKALAAEMMPDDVPYQTHVAKGTIYEEVINTRVGLGDKCDLIVMASHRPKLEDYLLGPNAARVLRHSRVSVLIVRD